MKEVWKDIPSTGGKYQASSLGNIRNTKTSRLLSLRCRADGYFSVNLYLSGVVTRYVHRLVAEAFVENQLNLPCVNHIDENKHNNRADNLEWCNAKYNDNYGTRVQRIANALCRKINQYDMHDNFIRSWDSIKCAEEAMKTRNICQVCKGNRKSAGGYKWRYADE